ncbi:MAG: CvpA family protein [Alphaproteobacteria bacterium]|nr:CvpA family protein [Alphaproteobacteria bacterium]
MEQLNNLDVVFLIIVGISALVGIARGMTKEMLSIIGWILAAAALFYLIPVCEPMMQKHIASKIMADIVAGLAILIVFSIIWVLTVDKIASTIRSSTLSALDRILGFVFGAVRGVIIVILIALMISTLMPEESKEGMFAESQYFNMAKANAEPLMNLVPQSWIDSVKEKSESLGFGKSKEDEKEAEKASKDKKKTSEQKVEKAKEDKTATDKTKKDEVEEKDDKIGQTLENNLQVLKKSGEELFNDLVQPKTAGETEGEGENIEPDASDLDRLLDVLEDRIVTTDTPKEESQNNTPETNASSANSVPELADKVIEKVTEKVAEKIADKVVQQATPAQ